MIVKSSNDRQMGGRWRVQSNSSYLYSVRRKESKVYKKEEVVQYLNGSKGRSYLLRRKAREAEGVRADV